MGTHHDHGSATSAAEKANVVRGLLAVAIVPALTLLLATGLIVRAAAWSPDRPSDLVELSADVHVRFFETGMGLSFLLLHWAGLERLLATGASWSRLMPAFVGAVLAGAILPVLAFVAEPGSGMATVVLGVACLLTCAPLAKLSLPFVAGAATSVGCIALGVIGVITSSEGLLAPPQLMPISAGLTLVALAISVDPLLPEKPWWRGVLVLGLSMQALTPLTWWLNVPADIEIATRVGALGGTLVLAAAVRGARTSTAAPGARLAALAAVLIAAPTWLLEPLVFSEDVLLDDTLAPVGVLQLRLVACGCAALATFDRAWTGRGSVAAFVGYAVGGLTLGWAFISLGIDGMPRQYFSYAPELELVQRVASVGAVILVAGLVAMVVLAARSQISATR